MEQLKETEEPALVLHLASVLLFQASTQCMLHTPGRCVPQVIATLSGRIPTVRGPRLQLPVCSCVNCVSLNDQWCGLRPQEQQQLLATYQGLVVKQLVSQSQSRKHEDAEGDCHQQGEEGEELEEVRSQLVNLMPQVKDLVLAQKKTPGTEE